MWVFVLTFLWWFLFIHLWSRVSSAVVRRGLCRVSRLLISPAPSSSSSASRDVSGWRDAARWSEGGVAASRAVCRRGGASRWTGGHQRCQSSRDSWALTGYYMILPSESTAGGRNRMRSVPRLGASVSLVHSRFITCSVDCGSTESTL